MHSQHSQHPSEVPTVLVPPPPKPRSRRRFEYEESAAPLDLSDHVERSLSGEKHYPTVKETQLEPQELTRKLRRIYLKIFGKGGMIL